MKCICPGSQSAVSRTLPQMQSKARLWYPDVSNFFLDHTSLRCLNLLCSLFHAVSDHRTRPHAISSTPGSCSVLIDYLLSPPPDVAASHLPISGLAGYSTLLPTRKSARGAYVVECKTERFYRLLMSLRFSIGIAESSVSRLEHDRADTKVWGRNPYHRVLICCFSRKTTHRG